MSKPCNEDNPKEDISALGEFNILFSYDEYLIEKSSIVPIFYLAKAQFSISCFGDRHHTP